MMIGRPLSITAGVELPARATLRQIRRAPLAMGVMDAAPQLARAQLVPDAPMQESVYANGYCYDKAGNRTPAIRTRPARRQRA